MVAKHWFLLFILSLSSSLQAGRLQLQYRDFPERIDNFDVQIDLRTDSTFHVTEKIKYHFGKFDRRGIYRDIPISVRRHIDSGFIELPDRYKIYIHNISVQDEKENPINFSTEEFDDTLRIRIGEKNEYLTGVKTYVIKYLAAGAVHPSQKYDEFYWDVTGSQWYVPIGGAKLTLNLPEGHDYTKMPFKSYTGFFGARFSNAAEQITDNKIQLQSPILLAGQGLSFAMAVDKGILEPTPARLIWKWRFIENFKHHFLTGFLIFLLAFFIYRKRQNLPTPDTKARSWRWHLLNDKNITDFESS